MTGWRRKRPRPRCGAAKAGADAADCLFPVKRFAAAFSCERPCRSGPLLAFPQLFHRIPTWFSTVAQGTEVRIPRFDAKLVLSVARNDKNGKTENAGR